MKAKRKQRANVFLCSLFLGSFIFTQGFTWFWGAATLPVQAHRPAIVTEKAIGDGGVGQHKTLAANPQSPTLNVVQDSQNPQALLEQGKALYEAGKFSEAAEALKAAATAFKNNGDRLKEAMSLSNLALAYHQIGQLSEAVQALTDSLNLLQSEETIRNTPKERTAERLQILAQTLDIQGRHLLSIGQPDQAFQIWQQAEAAYSQIGNKDGKIQSQINQAQALQSLGFYTRACKTLLNTLGLENQECQVSDEQLQTLKNQPDSLLTTVALRNLGDALQLVGDLQQAENVLKLSLEIAQRLQSPPNISAALFSLGNTARSQGRSGNQKQTRGTTTAPLGYYQQAAEAATSPTLKIQAQLNQLSLLLETESSSEAQALWNEIKSELDNLPPSRTTVYARINLAQSLMKLPNPDMGTAAQLLAKAVEQAKSLGDQRATAYALGNLGELYEKTGQVNPAKNLTEQALTLAQTINASDIAYRWQWQLGRLLAAKGEQKEAIAAYTSAIATLKDLRSDLVSINPNVQFSFRESVEPIYRQLVALLLDSKGSEDEAKNLALAREVIESLQVAELVNFFREDCLTGTLKTIDQIDPQGSSAVIYPIILPDRIEVVLSLPKVPLRHYATKLPQAEAERVFSDLRQAIAPFSVNPNQRGAAEGTQPDGNPQPQIEIPDANPTAETQNTQTNPNQRGLGVVGTENPQQCRGGGLVVKPVNGELVPVCEASAGAYLPLAQQVYEWLIKPAEQEIANSGVKTLVFVLDGSMLNLPMAVLNDGKQFLIEKYAIAYTPGLNLLDSQPLARVQLTALKAGLSEARQITTSNSSTPIMFSALPFVKEELEKIQSEVAGQLLLNEQFTTTAIQKQLNSVPFPVVHLATHGQFSSNEKDTFILTWDDRLSVNDLNTVLRAREETGKNPIELLVLSACQTAAGDKRAALGLAGVAVKAGARSTLATLWFVSDAATSELMTQFYQELTDTTISKAEALRRAQVKLLQNEQYAKPIYWAPYILVGNWL